MHRRRSSVGLWRWSQWSSGARGLVPGRHETSEEFGRLFRLAGLCSAEDTVVARGEGVRVVGAKDALSVGRKLTKQIGSASRVPSPPSGLSEGVAGLESAWAVCPEDPFPVGQ